MEIIDLLERPTIETFVEKNYLMWNQDVRQALDRGEIASGKEHFCDRGQLEERLQLKIESIEKFKQQKLEKVKSLLREDCNSDRYLEGIDEISEPCFYDFLDENTKQDFNIIDCDLVSENPYDGIATKLIEYYQHGNVLDFGSGFRRLNYSHVINYEIAKYISTDVVGVGEKLPFKDNSFDCILSFAVLEHVKDPFACAKEIMRCLKPDGILYTVVPHLQPYHGYPHHYYNMTHQGLVNLFPDLRVLHQEVNGGNKVISSVSWILQAWVNVLPPDLHVKLLDLKVADLIVPTEDFFQEHHQLIRSIPPQTQMELAASTSLFATKLSSNSLGEELTFKTHPAMAEINNILEKEFFNFSDRTPTTVGVPGNIDFDRRVAETPIKSLAQKIEHILRTTLHHFRNWKRDLFDFE